MPPSPGPTKPRPMICLFDRVRLRHVTRGYMSLLRGSADRFSAASVDCGQQKSRINKDPAEFDWKCLLRLTSRGEHSRALMGGERAQEMIYICAHHAQETSIYFATHACKKAQAVVQPTTGLNRTRKIGGIERDSGSKSLPKPSSGSFPIGKYERRQMMWIRAAPVHFCGKGA